MDLKRKYKILILEDDPVWSEIIQKSLNQTDDFTVILATGSMTKALECVKTSLPDVAIVDLQLNDGGDGDGITFLSKIRSIGEHLPIQPYVLVTTNVTSRKTTKVLNNGLADYVFLKPLIKNDPNYIINYLRLMEDVFDCNMNPEMQAQSQSEKEELIRNRVTAELDLYYMKRTLLGYDFLVDAICMLINAPDDEKPLITKNIYPKVGEKYQKTRHVVEMAIERTIQGAFSKTAQSDLKRLYPPYIDFDRGAPTNKELITFIANKIKSEKIF